MGLGRLLDFKGIQNRRQGDSDTVVVCACLTSGQGAVGRMGTGSKMSEETKGKLHE
jgi:hypothetical protein